MNWLYSSLVLVLSAYFVQCRPQQGGYEDDQTKINQYYCHKLKGCKESDKQVCGFDEVIPHLAVFGDLCTLYKANCREVGYYHLVDMIVCDTRLNYDKHHPNEAFEYIHIRTTPPPKQDTNLRNYELVRFNNSFKFHCHKLRVCDPGGEPVCGYNPRTYELAEFADMCTFHGVNCFRQGNYLLRDEKGCKPVLFFNERKKDQYGSPLDAYSTLTYTSIVTTTWTNPENLSLALEPTHTTTVSSERKAFNNNYSILDFITGFVDYLGRVM